MQRVVVLHSVHFIEDLRQIFLGELAVVLGNDPKCIVIPLDRQVIELTPIHLNTAW